jgi:hypothetical protein
MSYLKLNSRVIHWSDTKRDEIMKLLASSYVSLPKADNSSYFSRREILEKHLFFELFSERRYHLLQFRFIDNVGYDDKMESVLMEWFWSNHVPFLKKINKSRRNHLKLNVGFNLSSGWIDRVKKLSGPVCKIVSR